MAAPFFDCRALGPELSFFGTVSLHGLSGISSKIFQMVRQAGYRDLTINMASVDGFNPSIIPPLASLTTYYRQEYKVDFEIILPKHGGARKRLLETGLAYHIDPQHFTKPKGNSTDPRVVRFRDSDEQHRAIDKILNSALRTLELPRPQLKAVEWALSEITENVIGHSNSKIGGFVLSSRVPRTNIVEIVVADSGIGIARSLGMQNECEALERAIQEGVTRNTSTNQGNGLYGTCRLAQVSSGLFSIRSFHASLYVDRNGEVKIHDEKVPYRGTYLVCQIDCDREDLIKRALVFDGHSHDPAFDYLEKMHEGNGDSVKITAYDICKTFGSRVSGSEARQYVKNMVRSYEGQKIDISFKDVNIISSSFADELFGKLFVELGPMRYMRTISLSETCSEVEAIVDRAISQRSKSGL
ncbi:MAG: DUF4325 domain-containing protein [Parasphingorhabdus sp.]